jgi:hypothetical protein
MTAFKDSIYLSWEKGDDTRNFIVYRFRIGEMADRTDPSAIFCVTAQNGIKFRSSAKTRLSGYYYVVTSQSNTNFESGPVFFQRK